MQAKKIQDGERAAGNAAFWGYVWEGHPSESLTCNALEWQVSHGGGTIIEPDGTISINNPKAIAAFERARNWIGTISPPEETGYLEEDARNVWQSGNAAFMRNWPYAYALGNSVDKKTGQATVIAGKFDATKLPSGGARHAGTLGGWQLAVSKYSQHPKEAAAWIKFLAARAHQKVRAIQGSYLPTVRDLYEDADVRKANPFYIPLGGVFPEAVARPSTVTARNYDRVSAAYSQAVHAILTGKKSAADSLKELEQTLQGIVKK
jgi:trehalose/maltose transport system substrate-binding protein